jgi:hypothetical protein
MAVSCVGGNVTSASWWTASHVAVECPVIAAATVDDDDDCTLFLLLFVMFVVFCAICSVAALILYRKQGTQVQVLPSKSPTDEDAAERMHELEQQNHQLREDLWIEQNEENEIESLRIQMSMIKAETDGPGRPGVVKCP